MSKYNLVEKKEKAATYRNMVRAEMVDQLYEKILQKLIVEKRYRDPAYSAKRLADDLGTNTRYISAVVSLRFHMNYSCLVNEYRIKDAMYMLIDKRNEEKTMEEHFHDFCNALLVWRKSDGAAVTITDADFAPSNDAYAAQYGAATWRVAGRMLRRGVVKVRVFDGSFDESFG